MEVIHKYFPGLPAEQVEKFSRLQELYTHWNAQINVISRKDLDQLYLRHVLHSLSIAKHLSFPDGARILDVGTGGGFPGIPLAIFFPQCNFHLVDSIGKKIKVVNAVAQSLELKNVIGEHQRAENVKGQFHYVVSRAVTRLKPFYNWIEHKISRQSLDSNVSNRLIALKGGDLHAEIDDFLDAHPKKKVSLTGIDSYFKEDFFETKKILEVY